MFIKVLLVEQNFFLFHDVNSLGQAVNISGGPSQDFFTLRCCEGLPPHFDYARDALWKWIAPITLIFAIGNVSISPVMPKLTRKTSIVCSAIALYTFWVIAAVETSSTHKTA